MTYVLAHDHECTDLSESSSNFEDLETGNVVTVDEEHVLVVGCCLL